MPGPDRRSAPPLTRQQRRARRVSARRRLCARRAASPATRARLASRRRRSVDERFEHLPERCDCGHLFDGGETSPATRSPIKSGSCHRSGRSCLSILWRLDCPCCGKSTLAEPPDGVRSRDGGNELFVESRFKSRSCSSTRSRNAATSASSPSTSCTAGSRPHERSVRLPRPARVHDSVAKKGILPITPTPPERLRPDECLEGERNALVVPPDDAAAPLAHFPQSGAGAENGTSAPLRCE